MGVGSVSTYRLTDAVMPAGCLESDAARNDHRTFRRLRISQSAVSDWRERQRSARTEVVGVVKIVLPVMPRAPSDADTFGPMRISASWMNRPTTFSRNATCPFPACWIERMPDARPDNPRDWRNEGPAGVGVVVEAATAPVWNVDAGLHDMSPWGPSQHLGQRKMMLGAKLSALGATPVKGIENDVIGSVLTLVVGSNSWPRTAIFNSFRRDDRLLRESRFAR